jgi:hypothetical protein
MGHQAPARVNSVIGIAAHSLCFLATLIYSNPLFADPHAFNIPAGEAATELRDFAKQSGALRRAQMPRAEPQNRSPIRPRLRYPPRRSARISRKLSSPLRNAKGSCNGSPYPFPFSAGVRSTDPPYLASPMH